MKRNLFRHNLKIYCLKNNIPEFEKPTIKIVDFTRAYTWAIIEMYNSSINDQGDWIRINCEIPMFKPLI